MSIGVAVPFGVASAVVNGTSIVFQHRAAAQHAGDTGEANSAGLIRLVKDPVFVLTMAGDFVGFLLQFVALSTGPVVVIQPLVVLMLPVSLVVGYRMGGPKITRGDLIGVGGILGGLAVFLALIGKPHGEHVPRPRVLGLAVLLVIVVAVVFSAVVSRRSRTLRGATYGAMAGACFGTLAVMVDAASDRLSTHGVHGLLGSPRGLVPIACMLIAGTTGIVLTQLSFQVGALSATLPANLALDPFTGVLLGVILLRERIPHSPVSIALYVMCILAVLAGAIRLSGRADRPDRSSSPTVAAPPVPPATHPR